MDNINGAILHFQAWKKLMNEFSAVNNLDEAGVIDQ